MSGFLIHPFGINKTKQIYQVLIGDYFAHIPPQEFMKSEQLTSAAFLRDHRCSHLLSKSHSAQFISNIHLHSNLHLSLKQPSVEQVWEQWQGPGIYWMAKVTNLTGGDLHPCKQLIVTKCSMYSTWKDAPYTEMMIPGKIWLQASWICSLTSSSCMWRWTESNMTLGV